MRLMNRRSSKKMNYSLIVIGILVSLESMKDRYSPIYHSITGLVRAVINEGILDLKLNHHTIKKRDDFLGLFLELFDWTWSKFPDFGADIFHNLTPFCTFRC